jgi:Mn-dependent DtxR family transcriptional regulator
MNTLTIEEWTALTYIQTYTASKQCAPKSGDIGGSFGWSKGETKHTLRELEEKDIILGKMSGNGVLRWYVLPGKTVGVAP